MWTVALSLSLVLAQGREPAPRPSTDARLEVRVVAGASGAPVPEAQVTWLGFEAATALPGGSHEGWARARAKLGRTTAVDPEGRARLELPAGRVLLFASAQGLWAQGSAEAEDAGPIELRLLPDVTLEVGVNDARGAPCPGIPVGLFTRFDDHENHPFPALLLLAATSDPHGLARFEHVQVVAKPSQGSEHLVALRLPLGTDVERVLVPTQEQAERPVLALPETGRVTFVCPSLTSGYVELHRVEELEHGLGSAPDCVVPLSDGRAEFAFVGLGLELEYELGSEEFATPLVGRLRGPARAGDALELTPPGLELVPEVRGVLVDEDGRALASRRVDAWITFEEDGQSSSEGSECRTDERGGFRLHVPRLENRALRRSLGFSDESRESLTIPFELPPEGALDLGEIVLIAPGSTRWLERMSDDELLAQFAREPLEACLVVMAKRGGPRWQGFLREALEAERTRARVDEVAPQDLELLTALRRAQGRPDPLVLRPMRTGALEGTLAELPVAELELVNAGEEPFCLSVGGSYRSGRFARCAVEALDPAGKALAVLPSPSDFGGGMYAREALEPGSTVPLTLPLGAYVAFPAPGEYRVRVHYHDQEDIDDGSWAGRIVSSSPWFVVRLRSAEGAPPR
jgi:hypothetical protein